MSRVPASGADEGQKGRKPWNQGRLVRHKWTGELESGKHTTSGGSSQRLERDLACRLHLSSRRTWATAGQLASLYKTTCPSPTCTASLSLSLSLRLTYSTLGTTLTAPRTRTLSHYIRSSVIQLRVYLKKEFLYTTLHLRCFIY
jgi:hypothetical protein